MFFIVIWEKTFLILGKSSVSGIISSISLLQCVVEDMRSFVSAKKKCAPKEIQEAGEHLVLLPWHTGMGDALA